MVRGGSRTRTSAGMGVANENAGGGVWCWFSFVRSVARSLVENEGRSDVV